MPKRCRQHKRITRQLFGSFFAAAGNFSSGSVVVWVFNFETSGCCRSVQIDISADQY